VQSLVEIGSEMWISIRYKQTNKQTHKNEQKTILPLYIGLGWIKMSLSLLRDFKS
jgi:hypothetical protein